MGSETPGYPFFVAIIYTISFSGIWLVLLFQIFLNLISAILVYKITSLFFTRNIALLATFIFAIDIYYALYSMALMTDILFVTMFLVSIYFYCKNIKEFKFLSVSMSAFFSGIATLIRPVSYFFPIVIIINIFLS